MHFRNEARNLRTDFNVLDTLDRGGIRRAQVALRRLDFPHRILVAGLGNLRFVAAPYKGQAKRQISNSTLHKT